MMQNYLSIGIAYETASPETLDHNESKQAKKRKKEVRLSTLIITDTKWHYILSSVHIFAE